jgi:hypothetical protein
MTRTALRFAFVCYVALAVVSCNDKSPTSATPIDTPQTPQTPANPISTAGSVQVIVDPNPVPFSGVPVSDSPGCATLKNTWYYDHVFTETGGTEVKFTARVDSFDGFVINNLTGLNLVVPANGTLRIRSRWCSGNPIKHEAQSSFTGTDAKGNAVSLLGPKVQLMAP